MGLRVIYVMTHDSIGLGEDGPTHQPVEHLAMLRATPNLSCSGPPTRSRRPKPARCALARRAHALRPLPVAGRTCRRSASSRRQRKPHREGRLCRCAKPDGAARRDAPRHRLRGASSRSTPPERLRPTRASAPPSSPCPAGSCSSSRRADYQAKVLGTAPASASRPAPASAGTAGSAGNGAFIGMTGFGASAPRQRSLRALRHHRRGRRGRPPDARAQASASSAENTMGGNRR